MAFKPKIDGVNEKELLEYESDGHKFYMAWVGGMPEREHAFYYADDRHEFCFYADRKWEGSEYDVYVRNATIYRFHGSHPRINPDDYGYLRERMARFFSERWFLDPLRPIPANEKFRNLTLSWVLS